MFDVNGKNQLLRRPAAILATVFFATPQILSAETLRDALVKAYNSSGLLEQNRALLRAADEDVAVAASACACFGMGLQYYTSKNPSAQPRNRYRGERGKRRINGKYNAL